jgi:hypothetical protein
LRFTAIIGLWALCAGLACGAEASTDVDACVDALHQRPLILGEYSTETMVTAATRALHSWPVDPVHVRAL